MDTEKLISLIIVSHNYDKLAHSINHLSNLTSSVFAAAPGIEGGPPDLKTILYLKNDDEKWEYIGPTKVNTPWALFLECDEFFKQKDFNSLLDYVSGNEPNITKIAVSRFMHKEEIQDYAWVTTRNIFDNPSEELTRYYSNELRLVPTSELHNIRIESNSKGHPGRFYIIHNKYNTEYLSHSNICITRLPISHEIDNKARPEDHDIFKYTHQRYFDDTIYCPQFIWPHSVYHTIRMDYIPHVISGLKQGICNPAIAYFSLLYLIRFNALEKAKQMIELIPKHWQNRSTGILNAMATIYFFLGNNEKSIQLLKKAFNLRVDSELIAKNYLKMLILSGRDDEVEEFERRYEKENNKPIEDDFLLNYKKISKENKGKTATVSLCMITRDEEKNIERAVKSVDNFFDELIIVDTGSSDKSPDIAKKLGAKLYSFKWQDDFSAARNFALSKSQCDYIFFLDADEYLSPFFRIDFQVFKKILPLEKPVAYELTIGHHLNDTDWLFLAIEKGNFKEETRSIRIFPRIPGIEYKGLINEHPGIYLNENNIPIYHVPDTSLHLLHQHKGHLDRIRRKSHIYQKEANPSKQTILGAIKDFSLLGESRDTLLWLKRFYNSENGDPVAKINTGLHIGKILEYQDPDQAEKFYFEMLKVFPDAPPLLTACSSFLLRNNKIEKLLNIPFDPIAEFPPDMGNERFEYLCFFALKAFIGGDKEKGAELISNVLREIPSDPFAQSIRFFFLIDELDIEGSLSALDYIIDALSIRLDVEIDTITAFLELIHQLSDFLQEDGHLKERSLILQGALSLEERLKQNV